MEFHTPQISYNAKLVADLRQLMTLRQHYYPEGQWGWFLVAIGFVVQCVSHGLHMAVGVLIAVMVRDFQQNLLYSGMLLLSPSQATM